MPKFRLLGGKFTAADGTEYDAGDGLTASRRAKKVTVNDPNDLDEMFKNKFERLSDGKTRHGPEGEDAEGDATDDPPAAVKRRMKKIADEDYRPERKDRMSTRERAEVMDEEVDEDGETEDVKEPKKALAKKVKQRNVVEPPDDDDEPDDDDDDDDDKPEAADTTDDEPDEDEDEAPVKPVKSKKAEEAPRKKSRKKRH